MSEQAKYVTLSGSERKPLPEASVVGPTDPEERLEVTVRVRRKQALPSAQALADELPAQRQYLTSEEYSHQYGSDQQDLDKVTEFARSHGLHVVEKSASRRSVILSGNVQAMSTAFQVTLEDYDYPHGTYRGRTGPVSIPDDLHGIIEGVFGLDNRPFAKPHISRRHSEAAVSTGSTFTPPDLAKIYNFPTGVDGTGQTIGILELGGGYRPADLKAYFHRLGIKAPKVTAVSVDHSRNHPDGSPSSADGEVLLDIEVAGAVAPGAKIVVYSFGV